MDSWMQLPIEVKIICIHLLIGLQWTGFIQFMDHSALHIDGPINHLGASTIFPPSSNDSGDLLSLCCARVRVGDSIDDTTLQILKFEKLIWLSHQLCGSNKSMVVESSHKKFDFLSNEFLDSSFCGGRNQC